MSSHNIPVSLAQTLAAEADLLEAESQQFRRKHIQVTKLAELQRAFVSAVRAKVDEFSGSIVPQLVGVDQDEAFRLIAVEAGKLVAALDALEAILADDLLAGSMARAN